MPAILQLSNCRINSTFCNNNTEQYKDHSFPDKEIVNCGTCKDDLYFFILHAFAHLFDPFFVLVHTVFQLAMHILCLILTF